ncbi:MAG TPA: serine hydrolase domain-containing protein [Longimicrobiales bacterium]
MKRLAIVLVLAGCLGPRTGTAQAPAGWSDFNELFRSFVRSDSIVGASALVMRDGRVLSRVDVGFADRARGVRVDSSTLFHWGSITKGLTAISIMQLRDRGKLTLADHVVDYIPELRQVHDPYGSIDSVTIRMLLSHTAGFQNPTWPYGNGYDWEPFEPTRWEQLVAMLPYQQILFKPGTRYSYSNPAFIYLARIIEKLTGDAWESYVQKNIFAPLGLTRSYFRATPYHLAAHRSHNYTVARDSATQELRIIDHGADFDPGVTIPNGGWNAPLSDLARYTAFLMNAALHDGTEAWYETVLARSSLEEMWQPVQPMSQGYQADADQWMGLSFFINGTGVHRVLGHTGHQAGFGSFFFFNPRTRLAVIAAYNTSNPDAGDAESRIQQAAINLVR